MPEMLRVTPIHHETFPGLYGQTASGKARPPARFPGVQDQKKGRRIESRRLKRP